MRFIALRRSGVLALLGTLPMLSGCRDQRPDARQAALTDRQLVAQIVASNLAPRAGDEIVVGVEMFRGSDIASIASFTARIGYDPARLRVMAEYPISDGATRVVNPLDGETRVAGIAVSGFGDDRLFSLRATALTDDPFRGMLVAFDELHTTDGKDMQKTVRTAARVVPRSVR